VKKGTKVSWTTASGVKVGGVTVTDEDEVGTVLVAVDAPQGEPHHVIHCAVTWLTPVPEVR
jgi:hypothetical protein